MMTKSKRFIALLVVLTLSFACYPITVSAEDTPDESVSAPTYVSSCSDSEKLYCEFDLDVNAMHRFADSEIAFNFDIYRIDSSEEYTAEITSTIDISHNITDTTVYTADNNHSAIAITVLEAATVQNLESLTFEHITISLVNQDGVSEYSFNISLLNTQYGVFIGFIDDECLYDAYLVWLRDNLIITNNEFIDLYDGRRTGFTLNQTVSNVQTYSTTTTYEKYSAYIQYAVYLLNSGAAFRVYGYVKWADRDGDLQAAKNISVVVYDEEPIGNTELASVTTDNTGYFNAVFSNDAGIFENGGYDIRIRVYPQNDFVTVKSLYGEYFIIAECGDDVDSNVSNCVYFAPSNITKAIFIADAINIGGKYVKAMSGTSLDSLELIYPLADEITSFYFDNQISIASKDFASWDVLLHEYGHYVADSFDFFPLVAMQHYITENQISTIHKYDLLSLTGAKYDGCCLAWQEGWAHYFSVASQIQQNAKSLGIAGVGNIGYNGYHMELNTTSDGTEVVEGKGEAHELAVARFLWDITDIEGTTHGASDHDSVELGFSAVWSYVAGSGAYSFSNFLYYLLNTLSDNSTIVKICHLLEQQKMSATLVNITCSTTEAIITWTPAYEDEYVSNTYYLMVCDTNFVTRYSMELTTTTITLSGSLWQYLSTNFSQGIVFSIRTIPDPESSLQDSGSPYETGPYHSKFLFYLPD